MIVSGNYSESSLDGLQILLFFPLIVNACVHPTRNAVPQTAESVEQSSPNVSAGEQGNSYNKTCDSHYHRGPRPPNTISRRRMKAEFLNAEPAVRPRLAGPYDFVDLVKHSDETLQRR